MSAREPVPPSNHDPLITDQKDRENETSRIEPRSLRKPAPHPPSQLAIDDLTIAACYPELSDPPPGFMLLAPKLGRPDLYGLAPAEGLFVTFCPATRLVTLRVSVPRWLRQSPFNYPLVPIKSVEDLRPRDLALKLAAALSIRVSAFGPDPELRFPVRTWAVTRVAYAADLHVNDPLSTISGCRTLKRRYQGNVRTFGNPVSTLQWEAKGKLRVQIYAKAEELRARKVHVDDQPQLDLLAVRAYRVIRFETSLLCVRSIRALWSLQGKVPTLQLMSDPLVARMVLSAQVDRLRLHEAADAPGGASIYERSRQVRARLDQEVAQPSGCLPRTNRLTAARARTLSNVYFQACGHRPAEIAAFLGVSASAVSAALRDLEALGLVPDGSDAGNLGHAAREVLDQLRPHLLEEPPNFDHWKGRTFVVDPPWADDDPEEADDDAVLDLGSGACVMDLDEEAELQHLLGQ